VEPSLADIGGGSMGSNTPAAQHGPIERSVSQQRAIAEAAQQSAGDAEASGVARLAGNAQEQLSGILERASQEVSSGVAAALGYSGGGSGGGGDAPKGSNSSGDTASPLAGTSAGGLILSDPSRAGTGSMGATTGQASTGGNVSSSASSGDKGTIETWMLLEYADRGSLEEAIAQKRFRRKSDRSQIDMLSVCRTLLDVVSGMQYLHGLGLVHGDLKPANVLLKSTVTDSRGFIVKLTDFGLARMLDLNKSHVSTKSFGTIPFMSPELLSSGRMSRANDVFSFGIIMWQMIAGKQPYEGMAPMQVLFNVVDCGLRPDIPDHAPPRYKRLFTSCWHEWPENRPTFDDLAVELSSMLEDERAARQAAARRAQGKDSGSGSLRPARSGNDQGGGKDGRQGSGGGGGGGAGAPHPLPQPDNNPPGNIRVSEDDSLQSVPSPELHETVQLAADNQDAAAQRASLQGTSRQSAVDSQRRAASAALQHSAFYRYQQQEQDRRRSSIDQGGGGRQGGESSLPWLRKEPSDAAPDRQMSMPSGGGPQPLRSSLARRPHGASRSADEVAVMGGRVPRSVRIQEPGNNDGIDRMRSTSEPSRSVDLARAADNAASAAASGAKRAAAAAARLFDAPARLLNPSRAASGPSAEPSQVAASEPDSGRSSAAMDHSVCSYSDGWSSLPSQAAGGVITPTSPTSPRTPHLEVQRQLSTDDENARFMRLVQQSAAEGGPLRYSIELRSGDRHHGGQRRRSRDTTDEGYRRRSMDDRPSATGGGGGSVTGGIEEHPPPLERRSSFNLQNVNAPGAPPAAASTGAAGLHSPFTSTRSWRLRENSSATSSAGRSSGSTELSARSAGALDLSTRSAGTPTAGTPTAAQATQTDSAAGHTAPPQQQQQHQQQEGRQSEEQKQEKRGKSQQEQ